MTKSKKYLILVITFCAQKKHVMINEKKYEKYIIISWL